MRKISWHVNGFKNDKTDVNNNLNGVESARTIAKAVIKLSDGKTLETTPNENAAMLLENVDYLPNKCKIFVFKVSEGK